ncbi:hypothetical protein ACQ5SP_06275 [Rhodovulum sp. YNF3179]|mgnify:CR=1 FL=1|uniref:hypothetical protein n=1 Tax=Rhodovulum sp. YNF3179 TaxID=3425127 RepID=UPI003D32FBEF
MTRPLRRILGWALCIAGGIAALAGAWGIGAYAWGVIDVLDEPDQSWMFWGLVFLFGGIMMLFLGIGAILLGREALRR